MSLPYKWVPLLVSAFLAVAYSLPAAALSAENQKCVAKARRFERKGWIYLHIEGEARDRGFQHGYLLAPRDSAGPF
jgi:hypothetical protein